MYIKALTRSLIEWDAEAGGSVVINRGECGYMPDHLAQAYLETGDAEAVEAIEAIEAARLPQLDHDGDGHPGGSLPDKLPPLAGKSKAQLAAIGEAEGITLEDGLTNKQMAEAIEAARAAAATDTAGEGDAPA